MKRINFLLGVLAVASTAFLTSCFSSDGADEAPEVPTVKPIEDVTPYVLVPSSNVDDVTYDWTPKTFEKGATITVTAKAITAGKYTADSQTKKVTLGDEKNVAVNFVFTEKPAPAPVVIDENVTETVTIYQGAKDAATGESNSTGNEADAASSVVIDEEEKIEVGQVALEIPASSVADAKTQLNTTAFSIVVVPASDENVEQVAAADMENVQEETKSEALEVTSLQAICEPSGVQFTTPVTISVKVPESNGIEFKAVNGDSEATGCKTEGDVLKMDVPHFSAWDILLVAKIKNFEIKESSTTGKQSVTKGVNEIAYKSTFGWTTQTTNALVRSYLVSQLGSSKSRTVELKAKYEATGDGIVTYRVVAKTAEFDVVSGKKTFHVVANIGSELEIIGVEAIQPGHSGGAAN